MELKAEPVMAENLLSERMYFWEKMVWQEKERIVDLKLLYLRTKQFLEENNINVE